MLCTSQENVAEFQDMCLDACKLHFFVNGSSRTTEQVEYCEHRRHFYDTCIATSAESVLINNYNALASTSWQDCSVVSDTHQTSPYLGNVLFSAG